MRLIDADELKMRTLYDPLHVPYITEKDIDASPTIVGMIDAETPERLTVLDFGSFETAVYLCGACRMSIDCGDKFCKHCGRKVKWDD